MTTSDATVFAWTIGKVALIVISSLSTVVYLAWTGAKKTH